MALALAPALWTPDEQREACMSCTSPFSFFVWKHHCRFCGEIFCDPCSQKTFPLFPEDSEGAAQGAPKDERVCNDCHKELVASRATLVERQWARPLDAEREGQRDTETDDGSSDEGSDNFVVVPANTTYPAKMEDGTWVSSADAHRQWLAKQEAMPAPQSYPAKMEDGTWVSSAQAHREWTAAQASSEQPRQSARERLSTTEPQRDTEPEQEPGPSAQKFYPEPEPEPTI